MAPLAPQGAIKLSQSIVPQEEGMPTSAGNAASNGERIKPTVPASVPGASRMTR
jgi:hypothetical protein